MECITLPFGPRYGRELLGRLNDNHSFLTPFQLISSFAIGVIGNWPGRCLSDLRLGTEYPKEHPDSGFRTDDGPDGAFNAYLSQFPVGA
jgi:hypothetical protein